MAANQKKSVRTRRKEKKNIEKSRSSYQLYLPITTW